MVNYFNSISSCIHLLPCNAVFSQVESAEPIKFMVYADCMSMAGHISDLKWPNYYWKVVAVSRSVLKVSGKMYCSSSSHNKGKPFTYLNDDSMLCVRLSPKGNTLKLPTSFRFCAFRNTLCCSQWIHIALGSHSFTRTLSWVNVSAYLGASTPK